MFVSTHRPSQLKINLDTIARNQTKVMSRLDSSCRSIAVVKADAYGHGALEVSQKLSKQVDGFAVATIDEALELRKGSIENNIMVLGFCDPQYAPLCANQQIGFTIFSLESLQEVLRYLKKQKPAHPLQLHLKLDTGMNRIGVKRLDQAQDIVDFIASRPGYFQLQSIFTHMATADSKQDEHVKQVHKQYERFLTYKKKIDWSHLSHQPFFHCSNSAMALWYPELTLDAVRLGAALYGINPSNGELSLGDQLQPALSLETEIVHLQHMKGGENVSYGATYQAQAGEWIASLPIGYADGWRRDFQSHYVLLEGQKCPLVGRICMDQCMIRLKHAYPLGTKVTFIGENHGQKLTLEDWAKKTGTIAYEIASQLTDRLPRQYIGKE